MTCGGSSSWEGLRQGLSPWAWVPSPEASLGSATNWHPPPGSASTFSVSLCSHLGQDVRSCFLPILPWWYKGDTGSGVQMEALALSVGTGRRHAGPGRCRGGQCLWMEHFLLRLGMLWPWKPDILVWFCISGLVWGPGHRRAIWGCGGGAPHQVFSWPSSHELALAEYTVGPFSVSIFSGTC